MYKVDKNDCKLNPQLLKVQIKHRILSQRKSFIKDYEKWCKRVDIYYFLDVWINRKYDIFIMILLGNVIHTNYFLMLKLFMKAMLYPTIITTIASIYHRSQSIIYSIIFCRFNNGKNDNGYNLLKNYYVHKTNICNA